MTGKGQTRNEISGGIFFSAVVQGRDVTVMLPAQLHPALAGLPDESKVFTGRDTDLKQLMELLDPDGPETTALRVSAVAGLAGVGKTELVLQAARAALRNGWFPGGVLFVDMFGYDPQRRVEAGAALESMLRAVGIPGEHIPAEDQDRSRLFSSVMAAYANESRPVLVVIDNVSSSAQARPLLPAGGRAVVTSRHTLADLDARLLELDALTPQAGIDLLAGQLRVARGATDTRVADQPDDALSIARLCGGLPLALRIIAALLAAHPTRPLSSMAADLQDARTRLDEIRFTDVDGEIAVRSAFDLSYRQVEPQQARTFRLLILNPGPEISTEAVSATTAVDQRTIRRQLDELARAHLIETGTSYGRWRMHDLIRLYAIQQSHTEVDDQAEALTRLLLYYLNTAQAANQHIEAPTGVSVPPEFPGRDEALAWFDVERPNLIAAAAMAADTGRDQIAMRLPMELDDYLNLLRRFDDKLAVTIVSLAAARRLGDRLSEAGALTTLGNTLAQQRRFDDAITTLQNAIAILRELGDRNREALALGNLGATLLEVRQFEEGIALLQETLAIFRQTGDQHREGMALHNLSVWYSQLGRATEALGFSHQAIDIFRGTGDRHREGMALSGLGQILINLGRFMEATTTFQASIGIYKEMGDPHGEAIALNNLGLAQQGANQFEEAITAHKAAAAIFRETRERHEEGTALHNLGLALRKTQRYAEAITALQEAVTIFRETGGRHDEGTTLGALALALQDIHQYEDAIAADKLAVAIFREARDRDNEGATLAALGLVLSGVKQFEEAITALEAAVAIYQETGNQQAEGMTLGALAFALLGARRFDDAIIALEAAVASHRQAGDQQGERMALSLLQSLRAAQSS